VTETISRADKGQLRPNYIFNKCGPNIYFFYFTEVWSITITEFEMEIRFYGQHKRDKFINITKNVKGKTFFTFFRVLWMSFVFDELKYIAPFLK